MVECYRVLLEYLEGKGVQPRIARVPEDVVKQVDWDAGGMRAEKVKTFATEVKIFHTMKELETLDERVNRFIIDHQVKKVVSVSDTATTDNSGATIGLVRVLAHETS